MTCLLFYNCFQAQFSVQIAVWMQFTWCCVLKCDRMKLELQEKQILNKVFTHQWMLNSNNSNVCGFMGHNHDKIVMHARNFNHVVFFHKHLNLSTLASSIFTSIEMRLPWMHSRATHTNSVCLGREICHMSSEKWLSCHASSCINIFYESIVMLSSGVIILCFPQQYICIVCAPHAESIKVFH